MVVNNVFDLAKNSDSNKSDDLCEKILQMRDKLMDNKSNVRSPGGGFLAQKGGNSSRKV